MKTPQWTFQGVFRETMTTGGHRPVTLSARSVAFDHGGRSPPRGKLRENGEFFDGKNFIRCGLF